MEFIDSMANEMAFTENGAKGYATTGKTLLDMNFKVPSYRRADPNAVRREFAKAFAETPEMALRWAFYAGDVRFGLGERRLFRVLLPFLVENCGFGVAKLVGEYNRFDTLIETMLNTPYAEELAKYLKATLDRDYEMMQQGKPVSLLAKWMPSINTSSEASRTLATDLAKRMDIGKKAYRTRLSALRKYIDVVETKMCAGRWNEIDYERVPSKANLLYKNAFLRNDEIRRNEYLKQLEAGKAKINSGAVFPHDIVHKYGAWHSRKVSEDTVLENMWKALPDTFNGSAKKLIVVRDGSGSMGACISGTTCTALDVATAMAIYCSEHLTGAYKDKFITFSARPEMVDLSGCKTLSEKLSVCATKDDWRNTNIELTMDTILQTAVNNKVPQDEIPDVLIISDMEFDSAVDSANRAVHLFTTIAKKYEAAGYHLPKVIFWNVNSRTNTIPMVTNPAGVILVSGYSQNNVKMVLSNKLDPWEALCDTLCVPRYDAVVKAAEHK